jgi:hypothetical protein
VRTLPLLQILPLYGSSSLLQSQPQPAHSRTLTSLRVQVLRSMVELELETKD